MRGSPIAYSPKELHWIEARKEMRRQQLHTKFVKKFSRTDVTIDNFKALCKRKKWFTGRTGRYESGSVPANKGKKMPFNAQSAATHFKKGQLPHNTNYLGHERVNVDGYVEVSIAKSNPHTGGARQYVHKHRWLWEKEHGPIAGDMCLKCLDGNKANSDPSNWEIIPRAMLPRLNGRFGRGYDRAAPEVKPTIMAITKLEHRAREISRNNSKGAK